MNFGRAALVLATVTYVVMSSERPRRNYCVSVCNRDRNRDRDVTERSPVTPVSSERNEGIYTSPNLEELTY